MSQNGSGTAFPRSLIESIPKALLPPVTAAAAVSLALSKAGVDPRLSDAWCGVTFAGIGFALIVLLHFLVPWNPDLRFVSEYARDRVWGVLMDWSFAAMGIASVFLGLAAAQTFPDAATDDIGGRVSQTSLSWVLIVCGVLIGALSVFVCDSSTVRSVNLRSDDGTQSTVSGRVHDVCVGIAFAIYVIDMLWFCVDPGPRLGPTTEWLRATSLATFNIASISALAFVFVGLFDKSPARDKPMGLLERFLILNIFQWVGVVGAALILNRPPFIF